MKKSSIKKIVSIVLCSVIIISFLPSAIAFSAKAIVKNLDETNYVGGYRVSNVIGKTELDKSVYIGRDVEVIDGKEYYYALTNNHVVAASNDDNNMINAHTKITIYDHYMNPYTAELLVTKNNYDLALVKFSTRADSYDKSPSGGMINPDSPNWAEQYDIKIAKFAKENPAVGDNVSSYGSPIAQPHVCTIGTVKLYGGGSIYDNPNSVSNVHEFPVIHHTASILSGNSGGPLYGVDLSLVGINYGSAGSNDTYITSEDFWAVPISNVRDFLDIYVVENEAFDGRYNFLGDL